jgi:hypothetical protein
MQYVSKSLNSILNPTTISIEHTISPFPQPNDPFWVEHHGDVIFEMFAAVQEEVKQYEQKKEEMKGRGERYSIFHSLPKLKIQKSGVYYYYTSIIHIFKIMIGIISCN